MSAAATRGAFPSEDAPASVAGVHAEAEDAEAGAGVRDPGFELQPVEREIEKWREAICAE